VAHYGVAEGPCVTYSLGCRAPSVADLVRHIAERSIASTDEGQRYRDPDLTPTRDRFGIDAASLARARSVLTRALSLNDEALARSLGTLTTLPKALFAREELKALSPGGVARRLRQPDGLERRVGSRWSYYARATRRFLFVDGLEFPFAGDRAVLRTLCRQTTFSQSWIQARKNNKVEEQLLLDLVRLGFLE
jgi:50S ribosomal protein L16 3-hydroxylase